MEPRYVNYGEHHDEAFNQHKYWMIVVQEGELAVSYGRIPQKDYANMEERGRERYRKRTMVRREVIPCARWRRGNNSLAEAADRASEKASGGYRMLGEVLIGWALHQDTKPSCPSSKKASAQLPRTSHPGYGQGF